MITRHPAAPDVVMQTERREMTRMHHAIPVTRDPTSHTCRSGHATDHPVGSPWSRRPGRVYGAQSVTFSSISVTRAAMGERSLRVSVTWANSG